MDKSFKLIVIIIIVGTVLYFLPIIGDAFSLVNADHDDKFFDLSNLKAAFCGNE